MAQAAKQLKKIKDIEAQALQEQKEKEESDRKRRNRSRDRKKKLQTLPPRPEVLCPSVQTLLCLERTALLSSVMQTEEMEEKMSALACTLLPLDRLRQSFRQRWDTKMGHHLSYFFHSL